MSTRCRGWCPAVEKLASVKQAPGRLHVETWAGRGGNPSLWISHGVDILPGCADMVTSLPDSFLSSVSPGPGREVRNWLGWTPLRPFFPDQVFLFSRNSLVRFWGLVLWHLWIGRARNPGPGPPFHLAVEVFNVAYSCDLALEAKIDFLAVVERRPRDLPLFTHLPLRIPLMLEMLAWELLV